MRNKTDIRVFMVVILVQLRTFGLQVRYFFLQSQILKTFSTLIDGLFVTLHPKMQNLR